MKFRSKKRELIYLILFNLLCCSVQCLCDEDGKGNGTKTVTSDPAPENTKKGLNRPGDGLREKVEKFTDSSAQGRFPILPFRTQKTMDSTLIGKVNIRESGEMKAGLRDKSGTSEAKARSIDFATSSGSELNDIPASDQPYFQDDELGSDESDGEMHVPEESSSAFKFRRLKSSPISTRGSTSRSYYQKPNRPMTAVYRPNNARPTIVIPPTTSRPFLPILTNVESTFIPIMSAGTPGQEGQDFEDSDFVVPTFPSSQSQTSPFIPNQRPTMPSFAPAQSTIVPIIGGTRRLFDDAEFLDNESDTDTRQQIDSISAFPLKSDLRRSGRTRTRIVTKPIRRLVGNTRTTSATNLLEKLKASSLSSDSDDDDIVRDFVFSDIKCFRTRDNEYFGATIYLGNSGNLPYIRDRPQDPLSSSSCRMEAMSAANTYHMTVTDLRGCGVEQCGEQNMCLTMVFPKVATLALAEDEVTTIKCTPQKNIMSEIRTISFAGDSLDNRRSSSTVEGGTQEFAAEVGVFRQNPGTNNGLFVKRVNSGGVVQLGENLQLRSVVRGGDGWALSKLTDVKVWRMSEGYKPSLLLNPSEASEVITLVDSNGCRNVEYSILAGEHPLRDPRNELVHHFTFKAFLFRGQRGSEPLILTAKVQACQDQEAGCDVDDCTTGSSRDISDDLDNSESRIKRSPIEVKNITSVIHDWNSQLALRVVGPNDKSNLFDDESEEDPRQYSTAGRGQSDCLGKMIGSTFAGCFIMLLCCTVALTMVTLCKRKSRTHDPENFHRSPSYMLGAPAGNPKPNQNLNQSIMKKIGQLHNHDSQPRSQSKSPISRNSGFTSKNKPLPLPPIPKEGDSELNNNSVSIRSSGKLCKSNVSKILAELNSNSSRNQSHNQVRPASDADEYECIPDKSDKSGSDNVYIVYYCNNNKKKHRSTSAPSSLRLRKSGRRPKIEFGSSENQDEEYVTSENENEGDPDLNEISDHMIRRTVRSVKRNIQAKNKRPKSAGSFPARINKVGEKGKEKTQIQRNTKNVNFIDENNNEKFRDPPDSSEDSAYSGSTNCSSSNKNQMMDNVNDIFHRHNTGNGKFVNKDPRSNSQMTHFVTRNDSATRIIIIPETNV